MSRSNVRVFGSSIAFLAMWGCAQADVGLQTAAEVVPGRWNPPASTRAIAAMQPGIDIVEPPTVAAGGGYCDGPGAFDLCHSPNCTGQLPGTEALRNYIVRTWPYVRDGGSYSCRRNSNPASYANLSVHAVGRAIDVMVPTIGGDADNGAGDPIANWLIEHASYVGIQRVIWDGKYWNPHRQFSDIAATASQHVNHIHLELSVDGAAQRTRFFTEGPPPSTCPEVCYGTAAVRSDCSYINCADTGQVCVPGTPPTCGSGAPPEPGEAARNAAATLPTVTPVAALSRFNFVAPQRLFDTRTPEASTGLARSDGSTSGPLTGVRTGAYTAWPAGTTSAWLNVAAIPLTAPGFAVAYPTGPRPDSSTLNFHPPRVRANATPVVLGAGNSVIFASNTDVDLIADMTGAFMATGLGLQAAGPTRVIDTRSLGTPLTPGAPFTVNVAAPAGAVGVVASVAAIPGDVNGFLTAFPCGGAAPATSNINFTAGIVAANTVISALSDGNVCFQSSAPANLVVDVVGYLFPEGQLSYQAVAPTRLLDTRQPTSLYTGRLGASQTIELPIQTLPGMPTNTRAVVVNVVSVEPEVRGFLTAYPCGTAIPGTSSLNFDLEGPVASLAMVPTNGGSLCVTTLGRTHLIIDLVGAWVPTPAAPPPTDGPGPIDPNIDDPLADEDAGVALDAAASLEDTASDAFGPAMDAGPRRDAGPNSLHATGCQCRVGSTTRSAPLALATAGLLGLAIASRRKRRA